MAGVSKYLMVQDQLGVPLAPQLQTWRRARVSAPAIARMLTQATGISVSPQAVRYWLRSLDGENGAAA